MAEGGRTWLAERYYGPLAPVDGPSGGLEPHSFGHAVGMTGLVRFRAAPGRWLVDADAVPRPATGPAGAVEAAPFPSQLQPAPSPRVIAHRGPDPCGLPDRARAIVSRYRPRYKTSEGARCVNAPSTHADPGSRITWFACGLVANSFPADHGGPMAHRIRVDAANEAFPPSANAKQRLPCSTRSVGAAAPAERGLGGDREAPSATAARRQQLARRSLRSWTPRGR